jgi:hypothetical protein
MAPVTMLPSVICAGRAAVRPSFWRVNVQFAAPFVWFDYEMPWDCPVCPSELGVAAEWSRNDDREGHFDEIAD